MSAADVLALVAPQYAADSRASAALELGLTMLDVDAIATKSLERANALAAAHILTLADRGAASGTSGSGIVGPITSVSDGDWSLGASLPFAPVDVGSADLASTPYGLQLLAIMRNGPGGGGFWTTL